MTDSDKQRALEILKIEARKQGYARIALDLGYKDTDALKKWIYRGTIPITAVTLIINLWGSDETDSKS